MSIANRPITAAEFLAWPKDGYRHELIDGEVITMSPSGFRHGAVAVVIGRILLDYIRRKKLGIVVGAETGFILKRKPDTVRAADAAFVRQERIDADGVPDAFYPGPPDLAVEVVSPGDRTSEVNKKTRMWLAYGTRQVWIVRPKPGTVTIHAPEVDPVILGTGDRLTGGKLLPGFSIPVTDIFSL